MDTTTYVMIGAVVVLAVVVAVVARRRRDRSLEPVRLGPSWTPPGSALAARAAQRPATDVLGDDDRVVSLGAHTGHDAETVATVVLAYDELLSVLGVTPLPADHHYRVYDAYDPPVVGRDADRRPIPDPVRVARDIERRTRIPQDTARHVLEALLNEQTSPRSSE